MTDLVSTRMGHVDCFVAPNGTEPSLFRPKEGVERNLLTYLGSGAPWQGMDELSRLWSAISRARPGTRFRVISRDTRVRVLEEMMAPGSIEFTPASGPEEVARLLWGTALGFVVRPPNLVNRVAFPSKFAEYLGAGAPVAVSDIGWDISGIVSQTGCGVLLPPPFDEARHAEAVLSYLDGTSEDERAISVGHAIALLDEDVWAGRLAARLPQ